MYIHLCERARMHAHTIPNNPIREAIFVIERKITHVEYIDLYYSFVNSIHGYVQASMRVRTFTTCLKVMSCNSVYAGLV